MDTKQRLIALLDENTKINENGFAISLKGSPEEWNGCIKSLGTRAAYALMGEHVCAKYCEKYGKEYIFSDKCVANEIKYHVDAYMWAQGYSGYHRHISTYLFSVAALRRHCEVIDISGRDVRNPAQMLMFGYRAGIRSCYRGTQADPFRRHR